MMIFGLPGSDDDALQQTLDTAADVSEAVDAFTSSSFQLFVRGGDSFFETLAICNQIYRAHFGPTSCGVDRF